MRVKRLQRFFSWFVVLSELSHVFCCVLPSMFSMLTVLVGMGIFSTMPNWMNDFHDVIHAWEVPVIVFSGVVLFLGWGLHFISRNIDCHDTGCVHEPCSPKKNKNSFVLKIATVLFVVNVLIYVFIHAPQNRKHQHQLESQAHVSSYKNN